MPTSITSSGITFDNATTLTTGVLPTANIANAAVTPVKLSQPYTLATSVASTSGNAIDFTSIPSWAKRITVMLNGVSTNGSSVVLVRAGTSAGIATSNYSSSGASIQGTACTSTTFSSGFGLHDGGNAAHVQSGNFVLTTPTENIWVASYVGFGQSSISRTHFCGGSVSLGGTLDRIRITTINGTDTFDAGTINISYEG
jgi:hypothetical protein